MNTYVPHKEKAYKHSLQALWFRAAFDIAWSSTQKTTLHVCDTFSPPSYKSMLT